jgi:lysophospholipase L1-like esterase
MDWYELEVQELEQARVAHPPPRHAAVFYGSSSIRLWTTLSEDLGSPRAHNLGFGGSTLEACVWFFERLVPPVHPSSLMVYAGDNDLGDGRSPRQVARSFEQLIAKVDRDLKDVPFGFLSIKPSLSRLGLLPHIAEANDAIRREISHHRSAFYVDVFAPMLGSDGRPRPELFLEDGLHLSRAGYRLWTRILGTYRDRIFTKESS